MSTRMHPVTKLASTWLLLAMGLTIAAISMSHAATSGRYEKIFDPSSQAWLMLALAHCVTVYAVTFWWTLRRFRSDSTARLEKTICVLVWLLSPIMAILACGLVFESQAYLDHRAF